MTTMPSGTPPTGLLNRKIGSPLSVSLCFDPANVARILPPAVRGPGSLPLLFIRGLWIFSNRRQRAQGRDRGDRRRQFSVVSERNQAAVRFAQTFQEQSTEQQGSGS
jgi:hypothetical protein